MAKDWSISSGSPGSPNAGIVWTASIPPSVDLSQQHQNLGVQGWQGSLLGFSWDFNGVSMGFQW